jgi:23S rRNA pseudouridine2605 synthase
MTEDEKWRENFEPRQSSERNREGYKPYNRENNRSYNNRGGYGERSPRPYNNNRGGYNSNRGGYAGNSGYNSRPYKSYGQGGADEQGEQRSYRPRVQGGDRPSYNAGRSGYNSNRGGYAKREGGYQQGGYQQGGNRSRYQQGGYQQGGNNRYGAARPYQKRDSNYDPNAKYSKKKQIEYKLVNVDPDAPIRLNKFLANAGVCSRREADEFITAGVVSVNGQVVTELGTKVKQTDEIKFHDQPISIEKKVYVLLNKPKDYVTTSDDPQNRKTVMDLVRNACKERIYPVGRLDRNTTGVLLLTNDGDLASKLTHPKYLKKKIYHVYTDKNVTAADMRQIAEGITLEDGEIHADAIDYASPTDKKQVGIEIHSGKNRIVRRIFESLGYRVIKLDRVFFAGLTKKNLRRGDWRYLTEQEVNMLRMGAFE